MFFKYYLNAYRYNGAYRSNGDIIDDFASLSYTRTVNDIGFLTATFNSDNQIFTSLQLDDQVNLLRYSNSLGVTDYVDFYGIYRGTSETTGGKISTKTVHCPDLAYALQKTINAFKAGQANDSEWSAKEVDFIVHRLLFNNLFSTVPANRLLPALANKIVINASPPMTSTVIDYAAAYKNVLEAIQELCKIGGLDFEMTRSLDDTSFVLKPLLGTDRTATVFFFIDQGNLVQPVLDKRRIQEPTVVLVAGQGDGLSRATEVRYSANYNAATNLREMFVDARDLSSAAAMQARGDNKLAQAAYKPQLTFDVMQTPACAYGKHYFLGDKVSAYYAGEKSTKKIASVTVDVTPGTERIRLGLEDV